MAYYLVQVAYTTETWRTLVKYPQNRIEAVRPLIEELGGSVENAWFTFGDCDIVWLIQMPDNISLAAFSFAVSAGGAVKSVKTTPLLTVEEAVESMKKAAEVEYQPPGSYLHAVEQNR